MSFLEIESLTKRFGGVTAVDNFSLSIEEGSLTAIIGPNGCGKSTLFNLISGTFSADSGHIILDGVNMTPLGVQQIADLGVGRKFQVPSIFPDLTVRQNLRLPSLAPHHSESDSPGKKLEEILELTNLSNKLEITASHLSHGEKQWLEIGMVLMQSPKLFLLDEPTAGMTVGETAATANLIKTLTHKQDLTVIVIEHDIAFIEKLGCPLTVMSKGHVLKSGPFETIRNDPEVQELYFGTGGGHVA
ncbi:ATP-binding cassette domain-containing protein [Sneathiella limimaris]|uniref:ATP-binding cassette domain-containing protein n=1 Tax=Sneathiella limimaris TaxID=1964213 RepID=UPI00146A330B|nr:ATP-binding cassette domain-containing protein [Sneathiella limimaris]